jgi:hypothetical protein
MKNIHEAAQAMLDNMVYEEDRKIWHQKKCGDPQWVQDIIHACHFEGMLPDNYVFEWVHDFCVDISDENFDEDDYYFEAETYTHDLLKWLSSNLNRLGWVDEVYDEEMGNNDSNFAVALGLAQEREMQFVLNTLIDGLKEVCDEDDES